MFCFSSDRSPWVAQEHKCKQMVCPTCDAVFSEFDGEFCQTQRYTASFGAVVWCHGLLRWRLCELVKNTSTCSFQAQPALLYALCVPPSLDMKQANPSDMPRPPICLLHPSFRYHPWNLRVVRLRKRFFFAAHGNGMTRALLQAGNGRERFF